VLPSNPTPNTHTPVIIRRYNHKGKQPEHHYQTLHRRVDNSARVANPVSLSPSHKVAIK